MLYSSIVEKILKRGIEELSVDRIVDIAKNLSRATNVHAGGYGFYEAMEKHIHNQLHEGKIDFEALCIVAENVLANNIGST